MFIQADDVSGVAGFKIVSRQAAPAIKGTALQVSQDKLGDVGLEPGRCAIWASPSGICVGGGAGGFRNLTGERYAPAAASSGLAAIYEEAGYEHYILGLMVPAGKGSGSVTVGA
jgi:hypothetical protein